jgi:hypothetical protein
MTGADTMPLPWVRLDTNWYTNDKFVELHDRRRLGAVWLYMAGLAYCGQHELAGFIPARMLRILGGRPADADALVDVELWHKREGGWEIHDWAEFQQDGIEAQERRSAHARRAARARWDKES